MPNLRWSVSLRLIMSSEADKTPLEIAEMRIAIAGGKRARSLDLSLLGLSQLPDALFECRELKELFLWGNQLEALPTSLIRLTELQILCLQNNRLRALPDFIDRLSRLQTLSLAGNCLQSLPETLDALSELQVLCLHNNQLSSIPESLTQLSRLHTLSLDGNRLKGLPESLGRLAQLQILCLQENQLHSLPGSIVELESLRELFLHSNPALELPDSILGPTFEQVRNRHYSPLDPAVVLDYYFRTRRDARPLNEFKLILVGRGNVGKTSLVTRLVHDKFMIEDITKGIHITEWDITCGGDMSRAHIWDFGGQDIMHGTHQFFLTERSLYVLVLSGRGGAEDQDVEYWLKMIESFGGESPVIVVLNKIDEHQFDLNRSALTLKYPGVKGYVATDCKTGAGISALREMIA